MTGDLVLETDAVNPALDLVGPLLIESEDRASGDTTLVSIAADTLWPETDSQLDIWCGPLISRVRHTLTGETRRLTSGTRIVASLSQTTALGAAHGGTVRGRY